MQQYACRCSGTRARCSGTRARCSGTRLGRGRTRAGRRRTNFLAAVRVRGAAARNPARQHAFVASRNALVMRGTAIWLLRHGLQLQAHAIRSFGPRARAIGTRIFRAVPDLVLANRPRVRRAAVCAGRRRNTSSSSPTSLTDKNSFVSRGNFSAALNRERGEAGGGGQASRTVGSRGAGVCSTARARRPGNDLLRVPTYQRRKFRFLSRGNIFGGCGADISRARVHAGERASASRSSPLTAHRS